MSGTCRAAACGSEIAPCFGGDRCSRRRSTWNSGHVHLSGREPGNRRRFHVEPVKIQGRADARESLGDPPLAGTDLLACPGHVCDSARSSSSAATEVRFSCL